MKKCSNCNAEVENNFDVYWSCQYSFDDHKILDNEVWITNPHQQNISTKIQSDPLFL